MRVHVVVTVLTAIILIAASGVCLIEVDHATSGHLCGTPFMATMGPRVVAPMALAGQCLLPSTPSYDPHLTDCLAPPPKA